MVCIEIKNTLQFFLQRRACFSRLKTLLFDNKAKCIVVMTKISNPSVEGMVLRMGVVVLIGAPVVAYLWETLNQLLALHVNPTRLLISAPLLVVFVVWLRWLARQAQRWMGAEG